jgi:hypothetical protein
LKTKILIKRTHLFRQKSLLRVRKRNGPGSIVNTKVKARLNYTPKLPTSPPQGPVQHLFSNFPTTRTDNPLYQVSTSHYQTSQNTQRTRFEDLSYPNEMEFRPSLEFHPGAPYASQPVQSAQPAQAGNLPAGENPVQGGQWLPVDQSHHGGIPYGGMSHGNIVHGNMSHAGMSHGSIPNGSMSHGGMSHGSIPQGSLAHGGMPPGGIHHGNISHTNVNQGGISLWPHQQPGVVSAGRQFSLHGQERPYYGAAPFSYSHQQVNHPSAVHPPPGSYITRMNPSAHGYEVPYTPSRNSVIGQAQMVNRVGSYHFQHPQAIYNTVSTIFILTITLSALPSLWI